MNPMFDPKFVHTLPIISVKVGDEMIRVRYDAESGYMFRLDAQDRWNGEMSKRPVKASEQIKQPSQKTDIPQAEPLEIEKLISQAPDNTQATGDYTTGKPNNAESSIQEKTQESSKESEAPKPPEETGEKQNGKGKPSIIKLLIYGVFGMLALAAIIITTIGGKNGAEEQTSNTGVSSETTSPVQIQDTQPIAPEVTTGPEETQAPTESRSCELLVTTYAMIPGDVITEESVTVVEVSEDMYNQLSGFMGLYTQKDLSYLMGLVAVTYIPEGSYLTYDDVGITYSPQNLWAVAETGLVEYILPVHIPANQLHTIGWGYEVDMTITVQTKQTNDHSTEAPEGETQPPSGLEHESSILESMVVDTYRLQSVPIMDLMNEKQESLYTSYMAMAQIPSAFLKPYLQEKADSLQDYIPYYIKVYVTEAQAVVLETLDTAAMTVEIKNAAAHLTNTVQAEQSMKLQDVLKVVAESAEQILQEVAQ